MKSEVVPSRVFFLGLLFFFFVRCLPSTAFNITDILGQQPDFSSFNDALTRTQVASLINSRQSLTVLALDNGAASGLPSSQDALKAVLSLHVILDYFDLQKLQNMAQKSTILTTLYQTTGQANGMQGFLNVTVMNAGVMIGSAVPGSSLGSSLVKLVASQPYNISVLQVSSAIVPPGISGGGGNTNSSTSPPSPPGASPPPASSPKGSPIVPLPPKSGNAPVPSAANSPNGSPSNASATAPSAGGATAPSAGGATAPSAGGGILPGNTSAPSNASAATPAGATAPSGASADAPAGPMPGNAPIGSPPMPAGASPVADGPVADAPAPTVGTSAARRSYQSLDHASLLIMSLAVIWSIGQLT